MPPNNNTPYRPRAPEFSTSFPTNNEGSRSLSSPRINITLPLTRVQPPHFDTATSHYNPTSASSPEHPQVMPTKDKQHKKSHRLLRLASPMTPLHLARGLFRGVAKSNIHSLLPSALHTIQNPHRHSCVMCRAAYRVCTTHFTEAN
ncbi:hypothetical protein T440DRAFT_470790 [Plenodomus tracheiphilus IPT5]|uniref:Uncharacterized protein n=1 Tax=Plenodomus tracheiphilus IPT5 TaxID=1408161 RepID=A0A6A7AWV8_9PLEO|nr:hypothetical protein T440DRAFT_470790 [Plenodomus tracheiphilus IPT5]